MSYLPAQLKSLLMTKDVAGAPSEGTPRQVLAASVTLNGVFHDVVAVGLSGLGTGLAWGILEALDGDCKGQKVIVVAFDDATDTAKCTRFRIDAPSSRSFLFRQWAWPKATATGAGSATTTVSSYRTESTTDIWKNWQLLAAYGQNTDLEQISAFDPAADRFTHGAMAASSAAGDACMPVIAMAPSGVKITADGGKAIERDIISDTLEAQGVVVGAAENPLISMSPEVRGLAAAAGNATAALPPGELMAALQSAFSESLTTGDLAAAGSTLTNLKATTGARFIAGCLGLVNGDAFGISSVDTGPTPDEVTVPAGHLRSAPASGDVVYGGANYQPKATGHSPCSFLAWLARAELYAFTGGLAKWGLKVDRNAIAKYDLEWHFIESLRATWAQPHYDRYDQATPLVGRSQVCRIVLDGAEVPADVLSAEFELLPAPLNPGAAFGAVENKGAKRYGLITPSCKLTLMMEDNRFWHRYRAQSEVDFLLQVGRLPTAAWAFWATRAQIVAPPEDGENENLMTQTVTLRFLRPTVQGRPAFTMTHF